MHTVTTVLTKIRPEGKFKASGERYDDVIWLSADQKPTLQEVNDAIEKYNKEEAQALLKMERTLRLQECDWVVLRCYEKGETVPTEWSNYRDELRDLPNNQTPLFNEYGKITNIVWPTRPDYATINKMTLDNESLLLETGSSFVLESSVSFVTHAKSKFVRTTEKLPFGNNLRGTTHA